MVKLTPNNLGVWKDLKGTNDIQNFDYIVVLDNIDKDIENIGEKNFIKLINNDFNKIIHFQREHSNIIKFERKTWYSKNILPKLKQKFMANDFMFTLIFPSFINKTYDELKKLKYHPKNKTISSITSFKKGTKYGADYDKRINFLYKYSKLYPDQIDIFGKGWPKNILGNNYKGELGSYHKKNVGITSKYDGLKDYNYSIALENIPSDTIFSEKLTDCILSWTIPIYSGSPKTIEYLPENSFYLIDLNKKNQIDKVKEIIENKPTEENIKALEEARNLLLDKYNIWEQIFMIINDCDRFIKEFKLK
jgi:hypothetical protein